MVHLVILVRWVPKVPRGLQVPEENQAREVRMVPQVPKVMRGILVMRAL